MKNTLEFNLCLAMTQFACWIFEEHFWNKPWNALHRRNTSQNVTTPPETLNTLKHIQKSLEQNRFVSCFCQYRNVSWGNNLFIDVNTENGSSQMRFECHNISWRWQIKCKTSSDVHLFKKHRQEKNERNKTLNQSLCCHPLSFF